MSDLPALLICLQCGSTQRDAHGCKIPNPAASALADNLTQQLADTPVQVQLVRCFHQCEHPIAWALRAEGAFNYIFAPAIDAEDIAAFTRAWLVGQPHQRVAWADMPEALRATLQARLPPVPPQSTPGDDS